jgi:hypothetical protein
MSEYRWKFIEIPKPTRSGTAYKWVYVGMGFGCGSIWTTILYDHLSRTKAVTIIFALTALIFIWQQIYLFREGKRLGKEVEEMRAKFLQAIGPEVTDDESREISQS